MRVLFTLQPSLGHWHPLVPLAKALEEAGHEVAFASTPGFCPIIEGKGFRCFLAGQDDTEEDIRQRHEVYLRLSPDEREYAMQITTFAGTRAERSYADLIEIVRSWQVDLIVRDNIEYGGCIASEATGVVSATFQITAPKTDLLRIVEAPLRRLFDMAGVPFRDVEELFYRYLFVFPRPLSLWNYKLPMPPTMHAFAHRGFNQSGDEGLPDWLEKMDKTRPTVYATLGTLFNAQTATFSAIVDGLREEPINLIVVVGRDRDPAEFGEQPENVHIERYIPQSLLLPHCDLVVTHGGSGTTLDAVTFGLPMVMIPLGADQPLNAQICAEAGAAVVIPREERTPEAIREAVREVLGDPKYREAAQRIQRENEALPGIEGAVGLLERLAVERKPILAGKS